MSSLLDWLNLGGLGLEIVGAVLLAGRLLARKFEQIFDYSREASATIDLPVGHPGSDRKMWMVELAGFSLMAVGFCLQIGSVAGSMAASTRAALLVIGAQLLGLALLAWLFLRAGPPGQSPAQKLGILGGNIKRVVVRRAATPRCDLCRSRVSPEDALVRWCDDATTPCLFFYGHGTCLDKVQIHKDHRVRNKLRTLGASEFRNVLGEVRSRVERGHSPSADREFNRIAMWVSGGFTGG